MQRIILYLIFFLSNLTLSSQSLTELYWQQLTTSNQLRSASNSFLFKDSKDLLWIGSSSGLQRYDGFQIKDYGTFPVDTFGMLGKNIQGQMVEDENHDLWITTYQSLNHYDRDTERFTPYPIREIDSTVISEFHSCGATDNIIWLLHQDSLRQFDISTKKFIASIGTKTKFNRGTVKRFGNTTMVYTYSWGDTVVGIFEFKEGTLINKHKLRLGKIIFSIYPINRNRLLIGSQGVFQEFVLSSPKKGTPILWKGKPLESVTGISAFDEDELLIATLHGDLFRYDLKTKKVLTALDFENFKESDADNKLLTVLVDDDHNIWVSSRSNGIYFTHPDKVKFSNLPTSMVTNIVQRKNGEIWAFTNKKIIVLNEKGEIIRELDSDQPNCDNMMLYYAINDKKDRLWTTYYYQGQEFVKPNSYDFIKTNIKEYTYSALLLQDGRTIFSCGPMKGLFTIEKQGDQFAFVKIPGTDEINEVLFLYQNSQGKLIVLEGNTKLTFYDPTNFTKKSDPFSYTGEINDMYSFPNDSNLWIGGTDGLVSFNYETKDFIYHSKEINLPNQVFGILPDEEGNLWISSTNGIHRFNPDNKEVVSYNEADGIGSKKFSRNAHQKLRDGRLAFGGDGGLLIFDPKEIKSNIPLAVPQITNILIDGKNRPHLECEYTGATNIEEIEKLLLEPKDNKLEFHFVSKEYSKTKANQIEYRLFPEEIEWQIGENGGKCQYTHIEPGDYTFEIRAANSDGVWNENLVDKVAITVRPPFQKTWLFKALILGGISLLAYMVGTFFQKEKRREEQAEFEKNMALEKERLRIARDMHDDLGSRLSAISLKTSMLENRFENPKWKKEMEKLTTDAQEISVSIRETIWTVDARNDALDKLINYLMAYAEELFDGSDTNCTFSISENLPEKQVVSGKTRRMVFLSYKEILNNIVKHAQASQVLIDMKIEQNHFLITINDNGIGFDFIAKMKGRGNGLDNMRYRMEKIGGVCQFLPASKGTTVQLSFDLLD